jgi:hypothetical protein
MPAGSSRHARTLGGKDSMAIEHHEFPVESDPPVVRPIVETIFAKRHFRVTWRNDSTAIAKRGSRSTNFIFGILKLYVRIDIHIASDRVGECTVDIQRRSRGWLGGLFGPQITKLEFGELLFDLDSAFSKAGLFPGEADR